MLVPLPKSPRGITKTSQLNFLSGHVVINKTLTPITFESDITKISVNQQIVEWSELLCIRRMTIETRFLQSIHSSYRKSPR